MDECNATSPSYDNQWTVIDAEEKSEGGVYDTINVTFISSTTFVDSINRILTIIILYWFYSPLKR